MNKIGERERATQDRVIKLLCEKLNYRYYDNWQYRENNSNVEVEYLRPWLQKRGYPDKIINEALRELKEVTEQKGKNLYYLNKEVYGLLRYGIEVKADIGDDHTTVHLIDWDEPQRNDFAIAEEVSIKGANNKRPDIVFYVNGIAVGVIELKKADKDVNKGIRQNRDNQDANFIQSFFGTMGLVMAGNDTQGIRYGTVGTDAKYYLEWKEIDNPKYKYLRNPKIDKLYTKRSNILDKHLCQLCHPERLLEIMRDFTIFDGGKKKLCRHNQYFGLKSAQRYALRREGGIYWHTQGSGKSLSMVWFAKWILRNITDSRVLIITDRTALDSQIEGVFSGVGETIYRTKTGIDLIKQINKKDRSLISSLVHKFGKKTSKKTDEGDVEGYIKEIKLHLPKNFSPKGEIFVFIDECHRTQSGRLHTAMTTILGKKATLFGFTGTPLLKKDRDTSIKVFGDYIHSYKFNEAVEDGVVLDLRYEARDVNQIITDQQSIDDWFEAETRGLNEHAKTAIKTTWGTMQKVSSSKSRLEKIVNDIKKDFKVIPRLRDGSGNAILVASSIFQACKYYELFQNNSFPKCAVITSYEPSINDLKDESTAEDEETEMKRQYEIYKKMLKGQSVEQFETDTKKMFIKDPAQMKLLIVVDKLLTGFDAPSATYLYIDKSMRDHGLFQAICRVNRLDGSNKEYGYIIDYKDLFHSIENSIKDYTSEALGNYDKEDVAGLLKDRLAIGKQKLDESYKVLFALCEPVPHPKEKQDYYSFFHNSEAEGEELKKYELRRTVFYRFSVAFIRAYAAIANELEKAGYTATEAAKMKTASKFYTDLYREVRVYSGDAVDMKNYEPGMRQLIDMYIEAERSKLVSNMENMSLIQLILKKGEDAVDDLPEGIRTSQDSVAETIASNIRSLITEENPTNPMYYEKLSILLQELVDLRKAKKIEYAAFLKRVIELAIAAAEPGKSKDYPETLETKAQQALYDNLGEDEVLAIAIDAIILRTKKHGWKGSHIKRLQVENAIKKHIPADKFEEVFQIIKNQKDYD